MSDRDHAIALFNMAQDDMRALEGMQHPSLFGTDFFSDEIFGFHAQQAVEKMLKAWLAFHDAAYSHTHDLMALIHELEDIGQNADSLYELVDLNPFAVQYRYEALDEEDDAALDRTQLLDQIKVVGARVREILGIV